MASDDGGPLWGEAGQGPDAFLVQLRDYFAGQALGGYIASFDGVDLVPPKPASAAREAYHYADAMLAERSK